MNAIRPVWTTFAISSILASCSPKEQSSKTDAVWHLNPAESGMTYITIKNNEVAEINTFRTLNGTVTPDGQADITIDLNSLDTNNDVRDGRMKTVLFNTETYPTAKANATIDMSSLSNLAIGQSETVLLDLNIEIAGFATQRDFYVQTTRLGMDKVVVTNKAPLILDADEFDFGEGLVELKNLAGLDSITPAVPVTVSFVFER